MAILTGTLVKSDTTSNETKISSGLRVFETMKDENSSFLTIHYNADHTYTMQELVKEVTLKNHTNNGFAILLIKLSP